MSEEAAATPPARSRLMIIVPVLALLVGVGGALAGVYFFGNPLKSSSSTAEGGAEASAEAPAEGEGGGEGGEGAAAPATPEGVSITPSGSAVTNVGAFTVNLRGSGGGRVLRIEVQVETAASQAAALKALNAQLRDSIISAISDYTWAELEGTDGKTRLRDELIARVNGVSAPIAIDRLYFTQFVVQ